MSKYLLSICIPTYNRSSLLKGLIENIFSEFDTFGDAADVQVVIVDGNSEDNTQEIVDNFNIHGKIKYFRRVKKEGIDKDILKCVELADSKYCWLFSDDDRLTPGAINHLLRILRNEKDLTGCFCNRIPYDSNMRKMVAEINNWPGKIIDKDRIFISKAKCFEFIGMDFGFISSQVVKKSKWLEVVDNIDIRNLTNSYYLMVHVIAKMMDNKFRWLYVSDPLVKQRTSNDSLLKSQGFINRQTIEHNSFEKIVSLHYSVTDMEYKIFFGKMVSRLPRVVANFKAQNVSYGEQLRLLKLVYSKYKGYRQFWTHVFPVFFAPNMLCNCVKKLYLKYLV